ncbi:MAG: hypothetical protein CL670_06445 [Balneola sp.]|nr:hypothetical protein [Balneola sp.]MAL18926.1 hypothetical protein [Balneola sp.]MBE78777.1 hypothetical protein [Balneola sp.]HBX67739.1 hypothetical protein [Balneolaceae bacterium]
MSKKYFSLLALLGAIFIATSCDGIIDGINELPENPEDERSNPNDPRYNPFAFPDLQLANDGTSLGTVFTFDENNETISWELVNQTVDYSRYSFRFAYAEPGQTISAGDFVDVDAFDRSFTLTNLKETFEGNQYSFELQASYSNEGVTADTSFTGFFAVDAFQSRGFLFNPVTITSNTDGTFTAEIYLDEIEESDDLTAFSLVVNYPSSSLTVSNVQVFDSEGSFLNPDGSNTLIYVEPEVSASFITIDAGIAGNTSPLSGGGKVCEITFSPTSSFSGGASISISSNSQLRTSVGNNIDILEFHGATVQN